MVLPSVHKCGLKFLGLLHGETCLTSLSSPIPFVSPFNLCILKISASSLNTLLTLPFISGVENVCYLYCWEIFKKSKIDHVFVLQEIPIFFSLSPSPPRKSRFHTYLALVWHVLLHASSLISARGKKWSRDQSLSGWYPSSFPLLHDPHAELESLAPVPDNQLLTRNLAFPLAQWLCTDQSIPLKFSHEKTACSHVASKNASPAVIYPYSGEFCARLV